MSYMAFIHIIIVAMLVTNITNIIVMIVFSSTPMFKRVLVGVGYFLAMIIILILIYILGFIATKTIPLHYIRDLGILPILLGSYSLIKTFHDIRSDNLGKITVNEPMSASKQLIVNIMTQLACSADALALFVPILIKHKDHISDFIFITTFSVMIAIIAIIGVISSRFIAPNLIKRFGDFIVPPLLILVGVYILYF